ncbi:MAG: SIMPL domain-containing protein [Bacteroidales bacterium]|nr:SIMPL domain-containing protein [Bacteroidales bacterium]
MKRLLLSAICALSMCACCFSQSETRSITVTGVGNVSVSPDAIVIDLNLSSTNKSYSKAMEENALKVTQLEKALEKAGMSKDIMTSSNLNIYPRNESRKDGNTWKEVFIGYCCSQSLKIEFPADTKQLGKVLSAVAGCDAEPGLNIRFIVKNPEAVKNAVLKNAAENAKSRAEAICEASGVKLGKLLKVSYNIPNHDYNSRSFVNFSMKAVAAEAEVADMAFNPEDVKIKDEVTFVWEIKD